MQRIKLSIEVMETKMLLEINWIAITIKKNWIAIKVCSSKNVEDEQYWNSFELKAKRFAAIGQHFMLYKFRDASEKYWWFQSN
ncbi:hypothetical protein AgCh_026715 [Apium graveolens]